MVSPGAMPTGSPTAGSSRRHVYIISGLVVVLIALTVLLLREPSDPAASSTAPTPSLPSGVADATLPQVEHTQHDPTGFVSRPINLGDETVWVGLPDGSVRVIVVTAPPMGAMVPMVSFSTFGVSNGTNLVLTAAPDQTWTWEGAVIRNDANLGTIRVHVEGQTTTLMVSKGTLMSVDDYKKL